MGGDAAPELSIGAAGWDLVPTELRGGGQYHPPPGGDRAARTTRGAGEVEAAGAGSRRVLEWFRLFHCKRRGCVWRVQAVSAEGRDGKGSVCGAVGPERCGRRLSPEGRGSPRGALLEIPLGPIVTLE